MQAPKTKPRKKTHRDLAMEDLPYLKLLRETREKHGLDAAISLIIERGRKKKS